MGCEAPWKVTGSFLEIVPLEGPLVGSAKSARIRRCRMTFVELVHLCNMVERCSRASTSESAVFSENADPFRRRAIAGGRGPGGRFGRFRYLVESVQRHIYRVGLGITGNRQDAEDVLQKRRLRPIAR